MADESDQSGSALRQQLESALAEKAKLEARTVELEAAEMIRTEGLDLVTPADLSGVKPDELATKAQQLQQERQDQREQMIRSTLQAKGLEGSELESAVTDFLSPDAPVSAGTPDADAIGRVRSAGTGGTPPPAVNPAQMTPTEKMEHAFERSQARKTR